MGLISGLIHAMLDGGGVQEHWEMHRPIYYIEGANVQQRDEKWTVHFTPFNFLNCRREAKTTPSILYHELRR